MILFLNIIVFSLKAFKFQNMILGCLKQDKTAISPHCILNIPPFYSNCKPKLYICLWLFPFFKSGIPYNFNLPQQGFWLISHIFMVLAFNFQCLLGFLECWFFSYTVPQVSSVQSLSCVQLFATLWTAAPQASLSITNSRNPPQLMSIESVMPSNHLILCCPHLLLPSIFPSIRNFSNESALHIRWPKYWCQHN